MDGLPTLLGGLGFLLVPFLSQLFPALPGFPRLRPIHTGKNFIVMAHMILEVFASRRTYRLRPINLRNDTDALLPTEDRLPRVLPAVLDESLRFVLTGVVIKPLVYLLQGRSAVTGRTWLGTGLVSQSLQVPRHDIAFLPQPAIAKSGHYLPPDICADGVVTGLVAVEVLLEHFDILRPENPVGPGHLAECGGGHVGNRKDMREKGGQTSPRPVAPQDMRSGAAGVLTQIPG